MPQQPSEQELRALEGTSVPALRLLALFDVRVRNDHTVFVITQALQDVGLSTEPSLATCHRDADVRIVAAEIAAGAETDDNGDQAEELPSGTLPQHSFKIGDIPSARAEENLFFVTPQDGLNTATHIMSVRNFSQLPVIEGSSTLHGVVTWNSVVKTYETGKSQTLDNAMITEPLPVAEVHQELFAHLPWVSEYGYLLVRDKSGKLIGIVTASDITARFESTTRPFFVVGEIEFLLRKCLGAALAPEAIRAVPNDPKRKTGNVADLTFGEYVKLLQRDQKSTKLAENAEKNWQALGWVGVERTRFVELLDRVRQIRNEIAHFDPAPLTEAKLNELKQFAGLLKLLA